MEHALAIRVDTRTDADGHVVPATVHFDGRDIAVAAVVDQWWGPDYRMVKITDPEGNLYVLRLDEPSNDWSLLMFRSCRADASEAGSHARRRRGSGPPD